MSAKTETLQMFNEEVCEAMLSFCKTQRGRLTPDRKKEFQDYVVDKIKEGPAFFLTTKLEMFTPKEVNRYVRNRSGEFYDNFYKLGKEKLAKIIKKHLEDN